MENMEKIQDSNKNNFASVFLIFGQQGLGK